VSSRDRDRSNPIRQLALYVTAKLRYRRRMVSILSTIAVTIAAYAAAYAIRFEMQWPTEYTGVFLATLFWLVSARVFASVLFKLNLHRWRYSGIRYIVNIVAATAVSSLVFYLIAQGLPLDRAVPRSVILLEFILASYALGALRMTYRFVSEWGQRRQLTREDGRLFRRTLIVGAGEAGSLVSQHLVHHPELGYAVTGFVDDDPGKARTRMWGIPVLGSLKDLPRLVASHLIDELVVAMPSASPDAIRRLVGICRDLDVRLKILPAEGSVLRGDEAMVRLREVRIEDLLAREPVDLELPQLTADIEGQTVLITGAAGSIGSELARQVVLHKPKRLILFDQAETGLFYIDLELRDRHPDVRIIPMVGDILNKDRLGEVFTKWKPSRVFHAAAYKHVPMMEANPSEAVRNNVIGTWQVAATAGKAGAAKFVLISTDKAVNPENVMGMTKRAAELAILSCADLYPGTAFTAVRFGNVLGSQGSVIPIFKRQADEGRNLTVTHRDVTRYFMTIPEAVQLVLQASLLPEARSHIAMLDMGHPVSVLEMARNFLRLRGVTDPDEHIDFIGLRPGEKLHEELTGESEETRSTSHPKVRVVVRAEENWRLELYARLHRPPLGAMVGKELESLGQMWKAPSEPAATKAGATYSVKPEPTERTA
jgi:FlaA1/EpsC-like NDP-sugar epimerase